MCQCSSGLVRLMLITTKAAAACCVRYYICPCFLSSSQRCSRHFVGREGPMISDEDLKSLQKRWNEEGAGSDLGGYGGSRRMFASSTPRPRNKRSVWRRSGPWSPSCARELSGPSTFFPAEPSTCGRARWTSTSRASSGSGPPQGAHPTSETSSGSLEPAEPCPRPAGQGAPWASLAPSSRPLPRCCPHTTFMRGNCGCSP